MLQSSEPLCQTCQHTREWHDEHRPRHRFNPTGTLSLHEVESAPEAPAVSILSSQNDPVLRQALIDRGIISPEDLAEAQRKIEAIVGSLLKGMTNDGTRGSAVRSGAEEGAQ
jgi:hypothetical protein